MTAGESQTAIGEREIVATRIFDAPREIVFMMWTVPEYIVKWWGPNGFTTTIETMDVRPGGEWRFVMHGPDGRDYQNKIIYDEILGPERIVYTHASGPRFQSTATFTDHGGKTEVSVRMVFDTAEDREYAVRQFGAVEGLSQTLGRLGEELTRTTRRREITLTRVFEAPRPLVFRAWTDSKQMAEWWGPRTFTNPVCRLDPRPGGEILIHMAWPDGTINVCSGVFEEVVEPERLVFLTRGFEDEHGEPAIESRATVTFEEDGSKTRMTLHVILTKATPQHALAIAGMEAGWSQSLDKLSEFLGA
jgi:uncharacterized protein YndB with AHSA1/START domain